MDGRTGKLLLVGAIAISILDGLAGASIGSIPIIGNLWSALGNTGMEILQAIMIGVGIGTWKK